MPPLCSCTAVSSGSHGIAARTPQGSVHIPSTKVQICNLCYPSLRALGIHTEATRPINLNGYLYKLSCYQHPTAHVAFRYSKTKYTVAGPRFTVMVAPYRDICLPTIDGHEMLPATVLLGAT